MKKLIKLADKITNSLKTIEIADDTKRIVWKDDTPEELKDWFRDLSGNYTGYSISDLDECYIVLDELCVLITDNEPENIDKIEELVYENQWAYIYNADLLDWVKENLYRAEDVNDAIKEGTEDIFSAIQRAMDSSRSSMAVSFLNAMNERVSK